MFISLIQKRRSIRKFQKKQVEAEKIDTLIVSDIHLGLDLSRPKKMLEAIDKYKFKRLILNGDIITL